MLVDTLKNDTTTRYVCSVLFNLDYRAGQSLCPVSTPFIERFRFVAITPLTYIVKNEFKDELNYQVDDLKEAVLGTPAQISYLLGDSENGNFSKGLCYLSTLDGFPEKQVKELERAIFDNYRPQHSSLIKLNSYLNKLKNSYKEEYVNNLLDELIAGVTRAVDWTMNYIRQLEEEITNSRRGAPAFKHTIEATDYWLYREVERAPLDVTKQANDLQNLLSQIVNQAQTMSGADLQRLKDENDRLRARLEELMEKKEKQSPIDAMLKSTASTLSGKIKTKTG